jgi:D-glycero-D-manno-heptose 1,7-bisphosphate phosphatase
MHAVNTKLAETLAADGVRFEKIYFAPESSEDESPGRKPSPKFLQDAATEFGIDLAQSYMVGDKTADLQCGWNAGVKKSILVRTGYGAELEKSDPTTVAPAAIVDDISAAADWILNDE